MSGWVVVEGGRKAVGGGSKFYTNYREVGKLKAAASEWGSVINSINKKPHQQNQCSIVTLAHAFLTHNNITQLCLHRSG